MTANIQQHIVPRSRHARGSSRERGSVDSGTLTVIFGIMALMLVGALGFFYLQQVLGTASQGTDIRKLEASIVELREMQRQLELEGAQVRSLQAVEERVNKLNLISIDRVTYLASVRDRVAFGNNERP